ncbi:immunity 52 family protein [Archangium violaceum]|uniref:immunity 52 family protein n=1 Tax=Archangium violaceum TaxID=83451 RepID=UPI0035E3CD3D
MCETYYAAAYWGCRPESALECARHAETFFRLLSTCHPDYSRWYEKHTSRKRALQLQIEPTYDTFARLFGKKEYEDEEGGVSFDAWTGHVPVNQEGGMVMLRCGTPAEAVPNSSLLYFPSPGPGLERLLTLPVLTGVMRAMVLAWEPDWAVSVSGDFRDALSQQGSVGTFVGWLTYLSRRRGEIPPLPEPVRVEPVEDKGSLIILGPEPLSAANPEHVALGHRVQQMLAPHGLLRRVVERRPTPEP